MIDVDDIEELLGEFRKDSLNTVYEIDGFRSLIEFTAVLTPGLNVLVGPNGSGKTNFLDFIDFIGNTIRTSATSAVAKQGGVAKVFSAEQLKRRKPKITAKICGVTDVSSDGTEVYNYLGEAENLFRYFYYTYEIEISFDKEASSLYISREFLSVSRLASEYYFLSKSSLGHISATRKGVNRAEKLAISISPRLTYDKLRNPFSLQRRLYKKFPLKDRLDSYVFGDDESLFSSRLPSVAMDAVRRCFTRVHAVNISPSTAKQPDDIGSIPRINQDGSGLSAALYHLTKLAKGDESRNMRIFFKNASVHTMESVIQWARIVYPALQDISVRQDLHSGKFLTELTIGEPSALRIPLQAASDGTIKWLCLVILLTSVRDVYTLEEPENFMHPKMQYFLISLIRESLEDSPLGTYFLCSTHSETFISQCSPLELLLFDFEYGRSKCRRVSDPDSLVDEINKTGFGLGQYYASNLIP